ncbi:EamA family transporter [Sphingobacterium sp. SRCM116780]|uniref:EamA family transporter n=1 Tax=Sphingobacterium sp. SRCM116780 TaxID=2907623 RepID=UPI001F207FED|nr:EamA family transporter [Sphingobacterium sp. SRCM116780]UIR54508.1 EamA family transporter [Sphingobacterium sp. SRCM116780]
MLKNKTHTTSSVMVLMAYAVVYIVWGSTFFFIEKTLHSFSPFILGSFRFATASLLLMTYCIIKGYKIFNKKAIRDSFIVGFLLLFVDMGGLIWAEQYVSGGVAAIIAAAAAIWFVLLDKPKWKENFRSKTTIIGLILGFLGVVLLFAEQIVASNSSSNKEITVIALIVMVLGSIAWTMGSLYSKYQKKTEKEEKEDLHVMVKTAWQMVIAGVLFTIVATFNGEFARFNFEQVAPMDWFNLSYLILFGSILAFSSYIWLLQVRPATEVSTYAYVNPIVALVLSYFFSSHAVTSVQIIGLVVILFSVLLMNWKLYKNNKMVAKITKTTIADRRKSIKLRNQRDAVARKDHKKTELTS